jgi:acyl-CoA reductase-like NAD-dependent aldehyde dehydrogenase
VHDGGTFGPTPPIMKLADVEEGVRLANDSDSGLQARERVRSARD